MKTPVRPVTRPESLPHRLSSRAVERADPAIILTYHHSGADELRQALSSRPDLHCTSGTGLLPLCRQAAAAWQEVEGGVVLSALAAASIRSVTDAMAAILRARTGKRRWCEFAYATPAAAAVFLDVYPHARVVCLHRSCPGFVAAAMGADPYRWPALAPFLAAQPDDPAGALAAYWTAHTQALVDFQQTCPAVGRVRYEDLTDPSGEGLRELVSRLNLEPSASRPSPARAAAPAESVSAQVNLPPALLPRINSLLAELGYPALSNSELSGSEP